MHYPLFHDTAAGVRNCLNHNEGGLICLFNDSSYFAYFEPSHHAIQDFVISLGEPTATFINRDSASQVIKGSPIGSLRFVRKRW